MPIYDYECTSCGLKKEVMRKISEPNLTLCPSCGKETFAKQVSAPSFQLNGTGWYATDFKNSGSKASATNSAKASSQSAGNSTEVKATETKASETKASEASTASPASGCASGCACH